MSAPEQDPYYDSVRGKADKSEFGSLRMPMHESRRRPQTSNGSLVVRLIVGVVILIALAAVAKRYLL